MKNLSNKQLKLNNHQSNIINKAERILKKKLKQKKDFIFNKTSVTRSFLYLKLAMEKNEIFCVLFLRNNNSLIAFEKLFHGTINESQVYPRVIIQKALECNAAKVILAHNHPSGNVNPSSSDISLTRTIKKALSLVDIVLLDHLIVSNETTYSFVEERLIF